MNLLRVGLLMLFSASQVSALTIENKTPTELTIILIHDFGEARDILGNISPNGTKDFPLAKTYRPYTVRVKSDNGLVVDMTVAFNQHVRIKSEGTNLRWQ